MYENNNERMLVKYEKREDKNPPPNNGFNNGPKNTGTSNTGISNTGGKVKGRGVEIFGDICQTFLVLGIVACISCCCIRENESSNAVKIRQMELNSEGTLQRLEIEKLRQQRLNYMVENDSLSPEVMEKYIRMIKEVDSFK